MKTFLATASLFALLAAAPAQAQTTPTQPTETKPGVTQTTPPARRHRGRQPRRARRHPAPTTDAAKKMDMPKSAAAGDWRASKLIGQTIRNAANETIGDINDLIVDGSGKISSVIVGVGGFLNIAEKNVSMAFDKLSFSRDANNAVVVTASATKEATAFGARVPVPRRARGALDDRHGRLTHRAGAPRADLAHASVMSGPGPRLPGRFTCRSPLHA